MFKQIPTGLIAYSVLSEEVKAISLKYRCTEPKQPWCLQTTDSTWVTPDWKVDYPVPNFGQDSDVITSLSNTAEAEGAWSHELAASFAHGKPPPRGYFVPNFGSDEDTEVSKFNTAESEAKWNHELSSSFTHGKPPPRGYFVPNFGGDQEIVDSKQNLAKAEKRLGNEFHASFTHGKPPPRNYFVPNFGLDQDIVDSKEHLAEVEAKLNTPISVAQNDNGDFIVKAQEDSSKFHDINALQLDEQSDPICSSAGCTQYKHAKKKGHPMDYPVANFGRDKNDIISTEESLKWAEAKSGHTWDWVDPRGGKPNPTNYAVPNFGVDKDIVDSLKHLKEQEAIHGEWQLPEEVQLESTVNTEEGSDPICSSAGCTQYKHPKKAAAYPMNYPVPNNGVDYDILDNANSIKVAENIVGHKWDFKFKPTPVNPAKKVLYDDKPELDGNIIDSLANMNATEYKKQHVLNLNNPAPAFKNFVNNTEPYNSTYNFGGDYSAPVHTPVNDLVQLGSDPICSSAGCTQYKHPKKKAAYPMNYPVPNFGKDRDIIDNFDDLKVAEGIVGHNWNFVFKKSPVNPAKKTLYDDKPALDSDIIDSVHNLNSTETKQMHVLDLNAPTPVFTNFYNWTEPYNSTYNFGGDYSAPSLVQLESDPICSSAGCTQYKHPKKAAAYPMNYPVPNNGVDKEIIDNFDDLKVAEGIVGHHWNFILQKPPVNPAKKTLYDDKPALDSDIIDSVHNLNSTETKQMHVLDLNAPAPVFTNLYNWTEPYNSTYNFGGDYSAPALVQLKSDPICSSAGCWRSDYSKKVEEKFVKYPDPEEQGLDKDIKITMANEVKASESRGHKWVPDLSSM